MTGNWSAGFLRITLGLVFFHFGMLKFYPDLSPAELIASQTVMRMSMHWLDARTAMLGLAGFECLIGVALVFNLFPRVTLGLFLAHMAGTFIPLFVLPEFTFQISPCVPTLEGQYILKNLVYVAAGLHILLPSVRRVPPEASRTISGSDVAAD